MPRSFSSKRRLPLKHQLTYPLLLGRMLPASGFLYSTGKKKKGESEHRRENYMARKLLRCQSHYWSSVSQCHSIRVGAVVAPVMATDHPHENRCSWSVVSNSIYATGCLNQVCHRKKKRNLSIDQRSKNTKHQTLTASQD